ncbi:hypothetical protein ACFLZB_03120 [Nanoarchaeota archaeon]
MKDYFPPVKERMDSLFSETDAVKPVHRGVGGQPHAQDTLGLTKKLWSGWEVPQALQIASYAHDIDRTSEFYRVKKRLFDGFPNAYWKYKDTHQKRCGEIFEDQFRDLLPTELLADSRYMIERHEFGGERDENNILELRVNSFGPQHFNLNRGADILMVGDKLSYFYLILPGYFQERTLQESRETTKKKFDVLPVEFQLFVKMIQYENQEINNMVASLELNAQDKTQAVASGVDNI